jgi:hypothetical protein
MMNTQVATSIEQARELLALGVSVETSDMKWEKAPLYLQKYKTHELKVGKVITRENSPIKPEILEEAGFDFDRLWGKDYPSWSSVALLRLLSEAKGYQRCDIKHIHKDNACCGTVHLYGPIELDSLMYDNEQSVYIDLITQCVNKKLLKFD